MDQVNEVFQNFVDSHDLQCSDEMKNEMKLAMAKIFDEEECSYFTTHWPYHGSLYDLYTLAFCKLKHIKVYSLSVYDCYPEKRQHLHSCGYIFNDHLGVLDGFMTKNLFTHLLDNMPDNLCVIANMKYIINQEQLSDCDGVEMFPWGHFHPENHDANDVIIDSEQFAVVNMNSGAKNNLYEIISMYNSHMRQKLLDSCFCVMIYDLNGENPANFLYEILQDFPIQEEDEPIPHNIHEEIAELLHKHLDDETDDLPMEKIDANFEHLDVILTNLGFL